MTEITIEQKARGSRAADALVALGHSLANYDGLSPEEVQHMWRCVMEAAAHRIGVDNVKCATVIVDGGERPWFGITDDDLE